MTTQSTVEYIAEKAVADRGAAWTIGFLQDQLAAAIDQLPKAKQKMFLASLESIAGEHVKVTVTNVLTGQPVQIPLHHVGTCLDPSRELYHTM